MVKVFFVVTAAAVVVAIKGPIVHHSHKHLLVLALNSHTPFTSNSPVSELNYFQQMALCGLGVSGLGSRIEHNFKNKNAI